jgi:hypothetical protein
VGEVVPSEERLGNAIDDDCDGTADEMCAPGQTEMCPYPGPPDTLGVGICRAATRQCVPGDGGLVWSECEGEITALSTDNPSDGRDNDCDGRSDEVDSVYPAIAFTGTQYGVIYSDVIGGDRHTYFVLLNSDGTLASSRIRVNAIPSSPSGPPYNAIAWNAVAREFGLSFHQAGTGASLRFRTVHAETLALSEERSVANTPCGAPELLHAAGGYAMVFAPGNWQPPSLAFVPDVGGITIESLDSVPPANCQRISMTWSSVSMAFGLAWSAKEGPPDTYSIHFASVSPSGVVIFHRGVDAAATGDPTSGAYASTRLLWDGTRFYLAYSLLGGATFVALLNTSGMRATSQMIDGDERVFSPLRVDASSVVRGAIWGNSLSTLKMQVIGADLRVDTVTVDSDDTAGSAWVTEAGELTAIVYHDFVSAADEEVYFAATLRDTVMTAPVQISEDGPSAL